MLKKSAVRPKLTPVIRTKKAAAPETKKTVKQVKPQSTKVARVPMPPAPEPMPYPDEQVAPRLLHSLRVRNLLSFGPDTDELELQNLNVLVGLNASGKSNLIEVIRLLRALPTGLPAVIQAGGGIEHWLHKPWEKQSGRRKRSNSAVASIEAVLGGAQLERGETLHRQCRYHLEIATGSTHQAEIRGEGLECLDEGCGKHSAATKVFERRGCNEYVVRDPPASDQTERCTVKRRDSQREQSYFHHMQSSQKHPFVAALARHLEEIAIYSEWGIGRTSILREINSEGNAGGRLLEDLSNFVAVIDSVEQNAEVRDEVMREMKLSANWISEVTTPARGGGAEVLFQEGQKMIPLARMSDGALRLYCLLAILCDPNPPPLICIEEPEIGIHTDVIPLLVRLMQRAAQRTQLVVTTHSDVLIDSLSSNPSALVVFEQCWGQTEMTRLDLDEVLSISGEPDVGKGLAWFWHKGFLGGTF